VPQIERQVDLAAIQVHVGHLHRIILGDKRLAGSIEGRQSPLVDTLIQIEVGQVVIDPRHGAGHSLRLKVRARLPEQVLSLAKVVQFGQHVGLVDVDHRQVSLVAEGVKDGTGLGVAIADLAEAAQPVEDVAPIHQDLAQGELIVGGAKDAGGPTRQAQRLLVTPQVL
jgi:hypothetical protein